jgi:hypothetical protein
MERKMKSDNPYFLAIHESDEKSFLVESAIKLLVYDCHKASRKSGWYTNPKTGKEIKRNVPEMMMLMVSEISEAMEAFRKKLNDDKLPERMGLEVEFADLLIRVFDFAGYIKHNPDYPEYQEFDLAGAILDKRRFNDHREDHKLENRAKEGGKQF